MPAISLPFGLVVMSFVVALNGSPGHTDPEKLSARDIEAIKSARQRYVAACLAGNWSEATNQWTEDGVRMVSGGKTEEGRTALLRHFDAIDRILTWDETWDDIRGSGTLAYARTRGTLTAKLAGQAEPVSISAKSLTVFRKQPDGRWLIAIDCYNPDPVSGK